MKAQYLATKKQRVASIVIATIMLLYGAFSAARPGKITDTNEARLLLKAFENQLADAIAV